MRTTIICILVAVLGMVFTSTTISGQDADQSKTESPDTPVHVGVLERGEEKHTDVDRNVSDEFLNGENPYHEEGSSGETASLLASNPSVNFVKIHTICARIPNQQLHSLDVLYFPSEWATGGRKTYEVLKDRSEDIRKFLKKGGGLLVYQPNPHSRAGEQLKIECFPYSLTVHNEYDEDREPEKTVDKWPEAVPVPFPADRVLEHDAEYVVITRKGKSMSPSLLVAKYGSGRILINTSNDIKTPGSVEMPSAERTLNNPTLIRNSLRWLSNRFPKKREARDRKKRRKSVLDLVQKLGNKSYKVRKKATNKLVRMSQQYPIRPILEEKHKETDNPEVKKRLDYVLDKSYVQQLPKLFEKHAGGE